MKLYRRQFLATTTKVTAASLLLPAWACSNAPREPGTDSASTTDMDPELKLEAFGLQLYTLRDVISDDPKAILKQVGEMGYTQIESYEGEQGMFWGMSPGEFKDYCADQGLSVVASHCNFRENFEEKAAQAAEAGMQYLICPYGKQENLDSYKLQAEEFNEAGEVCRRYGMRFAYHNHAYSFQDVGGQLPQNVMMELTDPELVDFEMDIYWVVTAGKDPIEWFDKYPDRWRLCHVKDRMKSAGPDEREATCDLGTGSIDYPTILSKASERGMTYFIVEQERYDNSTPIKSARVGAEYLKQFV